MVLYIWKMKLFPLSFILIINNIMAYFISSVVVALSPKTVKEVGPMKSLVISLDPVPGSTLLHTVEFVSKHPLIKGLLSDYRIVNLTFKYSEL